MIDITPTTRSRRITGAFLVTSAALAAVGSIVLGTAFGWPDVLDEPGTSALPKFAAAETAVRIGFVLQLLSSLLLVPAAFGLQAALTRGDTAAKVLTVFGVGGALYQCLGWVRWPITVPLLSAGYADPSAGETQRIAIAATYDVLNGYAGAAVGEHLGWLLQAPWAIGIAVIAYRRGLPRWFALVGIVASVGWALLIVPEPYVPALAGDLLSAVAFSVYTVWFVWLAALGVLVALRPVTVGEPQPAGQR